MDSNQNNDHTNGTVIIVENPEIIERENYSGEIVSLLQGYAFLKNIKRAYETINTNGDVFCVIPEKHNFAIGDLIQFTKLESDQERPGKFRTDTICLETNTRAINLGALSKVQSPYHHLKKIISEEEITQAGQNKPFATFIQSIAWMLNQGFGFDSEAITKHTENFIRNAFPELIPLGINYSIKNDVDKESEVKMIDEAIALYNSSGLQGQAESVKVQYEKFLAVREVFNMMLEVDLLRPDTVIDIKHLPELTYAFPVWYTYGKKQAVQDEEDDDDPKISHVTKFFCNLINSQEYAWFYQIYNRRTRPLKNFSGKDIMPPSIMKILNKAKNVFDYIAIMTPYHDIASKEWSDSNWLRNIDPILIGFIQDVPFMFILGRWSGTGVFPLILDCIADTSNHLKLNKHLLENFRTNTYWYKGNSGVSSDQPLLGSSGNHKNGLEEFADRLLAAYTEGKLFEFLRGELSAN